MIKNKYGIFFCFMMALSLKNFVYAEQEKKPLITIQEVTSPKGLKAWLVEDHSIPVVSMQISFEGGALLDPKDREGLSAVMASMMTEGAGPYTQETYFEYTQDYAIDLAFDSTDDAFNIGFRTTREHLDRSIQFLKTTLYQTHFNEKELKKIKDAYRVQLENLIKTPEYIAGEAMDKMLFKGHPYERSKAGSIESIRKIQRTDLQSLKQKQLKKNYLTVGVCGDITAKELQSKLDDLFADLGEEDLLSSIKRVDLPKEPSTQIIKNKRPQSTVIFAQPSLPSHSPDYIKVMLLNKVLGEGFSSRLMRALRIEGGLVYGVNTSPISKKYADVFMINFASDNQKVRQAIEMTKQQIVLLREKGLTQEEFDYAKESLKSGYALRFNSSLNIASMVLAYQRLGLPIDYADKREHLINAVTLEEMNAFAKAFLMPERLSYVVVGEPQ